MSTEEVQVSRKRAASEEAEVTITVKAKKSDFPVTATITLNSDQPKSYQKKSYQQKTFHVEYMEASDAASSALVVTPQRTYSESHFSMPSTAPPSPDGAEKYVRKAKGNNELNCSPASQGPLDYLIRVPKQEDCLNLVQCIIKAHEHGMRFGPYDLEYLCDLFGDVVHLVGFPGDEQEELVGALRLLTHSPNRPWTWDADQLRCLVEKLNDELMADPRFL